MRRQHFQNPAAPRPLGWRRWNLAHIIFYRSGDTTIRKRNFEFRPLRAARGHPELSSVGRDDPSRAGCLLRLGFVFGWLCWDVCYDVKILSFLYCCNIMEKRLQLLPWNFQNRRATDHAGTMEVWPDTSNTGIARPSSASYPIQLTMIVFKCLHCLAPSYPSDDCVLTSPAAGRPSTSSAVYRHHEKQF